MISWAVMLKSTDAGASLRQALDARRFSTAHKKMISWWASSTGDLQSPLSCLPSGSSFGWLFMILMARSPACWGLFASINSKMSKWIQKDWVQVQRSVVGCSFSSATRFLNSSALKYPKNSSMFGFLVALGSANRLMVLSMLKFLKGEERRDPEIPTTPLGLPHSLKTKQ
jgi:hypothetical protein